ncbi:MAG: NAD(P)/FAD-dependent oxidoreductase, partial [Nocardioidaceae bacterium]
FPSSAGKVARLRGSSRADAVRMMRALRDTVDEVGRVAAVDGIECHYSKGGTTVFVRSKAQLARARADVAAAHADGDTDADLRLLDAREASERAQATRLVGATFTPHCARVHPARLVRGLAEVVERRGVSIYERTAVTSISPSLVTTPIGRVRASYVVRATEGYTPNLPGTKRAVIPVYSLIVATEPLPESVWDQIGLAGRETFSDYRHLIIYGQRTADDRLVFGGRGAPYHFGSSVRPEYDRVDAVFEALRETLVDLFPAVRGHQFTHSWGGPLGIARDWMASVGLDRRTGIGWAGGYVGDGLSTTNLSGRTLADLITQTPSDLVTLPWVDHHSRRWEPEPLRWLGVNSGLRAMAVADREEALTGRPSVVARAMSTFIGGH